MLYIYGIMLVGAVCGIVGMIIWFLVQGLDE